MWGSRRALNAVCGPRRTRGALPALATGAVLLVSGCGGGGRQDAHEAKGTFAMEVVKASFPAAQSIARPTQFELEVRNAGEHAVPSVAVTLDSFYYTEHFPELSAGKRPIWVIERGPGQPAKPPVATQEVSTPGGGQTAYVNTWALGPLASRHTQRFIWSVVPVKAGAHSVHFSVAAGLAGRARAELPGGGPVQGGFNVQVAPAPPSTHVDPSTGRVVVGLYPRIP